MMISVHKLEAAIIQITPQQLSSLLTWLEDYYAEWNQRTDENTDPSLVEQSAPELDEQRDVTPPR